MQKSQIGWNFNSKANESYCLYTSGPPLCRFVWLPYAHESLEKISVTARWPLIINKCLFLHPEKMKEILTSKRSSRGHVNMHLFITKGHVALTIGPNTVHRQVT